MYKKNNNNYNLKKDIHEYYDEIDKMCENLINDGNYNFFITINLKNEYNNFNEKEIMTEEEYLIFNSNNKIIELKHEKLVKILNDNIEMLTYVYTAPEINKNNKIYLHVIIGIRCFFNYSNNLKTNIKNLIRDKFEIDSK